MWFRRKPTVIEAEQFHLGQQLSPWLAMATCQGSPTCSETRRRHVHTMHDDQVVILADGDWVTPEPDGQHFYPIKNAVLMQNFDLVQPVAGTDRAASAPDAPMILTAPDLPVPMDWTPASVAEIIRRHNISLPMLQEMLSDGGGE